MKSQEYIAILEEFFEYADLEWNEFIFTRDYGDLDDDDREITIKNKILEVMKK